MNKVLKTIIASSILALAAGNAHANAITAWECEKTDSGQTVTLTTQSAVSSSAVINIDGTAQSGSVTITGDQASVSIATSVQCWDVDFTITDGSETFGL